MKTFKKFVAEAKDQKEYDFEGEMAKNDLYIIGVHAQRISSMLEDDTNLPEWVQSKITLAKSYLSSVDDYLAAEMREGVDEGIGSGIAKAVGLVGKSILKPIAKSVLLSDKKDEEEEDDENI